jgi:prepilin-type processing-associated H-X9-DG protein
MPGFKGAQMIYLNHIVPAYAAYCVEQKDAIAWLMKALQRATAGTAPDDPARNRALQLYERFLGNSSIATRRSVLPDYRHTDWNSMVLFKDASRMDGTATPWMSPPLENRMMVFAEAALGLARSAYQSAEEAPSYLIEVSCTGYDAPYTAQKLLLEKGWQNATKLLKLGHMGCYASVPALNLAADLLRNQPNERPISIFSVELCSLHLAPHACEADQLVANILFADGSARMDLSHRRSPQCLAVLDHSETLIPDSTDCMTWRPGDSYFRMVLSRKVGVKIKEVLRDHVRQFLAQHGLRIQDIDRFAVHPGGPLIIETVQRTLELDEEAVRHSKAILQQFGNMSSSTLPHIWASMQNDPEVKAGERIVSLAFGPGLTLMMNLLAKDI